MRTCALLLLSLAQCVATIDEGLITGGASPCETSAGGAGEGGATEGEGQGARGGDCAADSGSGGAAASD